MSSFLVLHLPNGRNVIPHMGNTASCIADAVGLRTAGIRHMTHARNSHAMVMLNSHMQAGHLVRRVSKSASTFGSSYLEISPVVVAGN